MGDTLDSFLDDFYKTQQAKPIDTGIVEEDGADDARSFLRDYLTNKYEGMSGGVPQVGGSGEQSGWKSGYEKTGIYTPEEEKQILTESPWKTFARGVGRDVSAIPEVAAGALARGGADAVKFADKVSRMARFEVPLPITREQQERVEAKRYGPIQDVSDWGERMVSEADMNPIARGVVAGIAEAAPTIATLTPFMKMGSALTKLSPALQSAVGFATHGAMTGLAENDVRAAVKGAVSGATLGPVLKLAKQVKPKYLQMLAEGLGFASATAASEAIVEGKLPPVEDAVTSALMGMVFNAYGQQRGARGQKVLDEFKRVESERVNVEDKALRAAEKIAEARSMMSADRTARRAEREPKKDSLESFLMDLEKRKEPEIEFIDPDKLAAGERAAHGGGSTGVGSSGEEILRGGLVRVGRDGIQSASKIRDLPLDKKHGQALFRLHPQTGELDLIDSKGISKEAAIEKYGNRAMNVLTPGGTEAASGAKRMDVRRDSMELRYESPEQRAEAEALREYERRDRALMQRAEKSLRNLYEPEKKIIREAIDTDFRAGSQFYRNWFNKAETLRDMTKQAKRKGVRLALNENPEIMEQLSRGAYGRSRAYLEDGVYRNGEKVAEGPIRILDTFEQRSEFVTRKEFEYNLNKYLQSRRVIQDLAGRSTTVEGKEKPLVTDAQYSAAQGYLDRLAREHPREFQMYERRVAPEIYKFQHEMLNELLDSGVISKPEYLEIKKANPNHVPFDRIFPEEDIYNIMGGSFRGKPIKKFKGSEKEVRNVLETIVGKTHQIVNEAVQNRMRLSIADLADLFPTQVQKNKRQMESIEISAQELNRRLKESSVTEKIRIFRPKELNVGKNDMLVYRNGKPEVYTVSKGVQDALKQFEPKGGSLAWRIIRAGTRILRTGATATPDFAISNAIRDSLGAFVNVGPEAMPYKGKRLRVTPFIDPMRAVADIIGKADVYYDWLRNYGGMAGIVDLNPNGLAKSLEQMRTTEGRDMVRKSINKSGGIILHPIQALEAFSSIMESATRLAVYKRAKKLGLPVEVSAIASRESTIDFGRFGLSGRGVNDLIAFFNAGLQGVDRMARAAKSDPAGFMTKAITSVLVPEVAFFLMNMNDPEYFEEPRWKRDLFWSIPVGGRRLWIPKPFIIGQTFGSLPGRFMEYAHTNDPQAFNGLVDLFLEATSPVGIEGVGNLIPTAFKPTIEWLTNYNFFLGRNIVSPYKMDVKEKYKYNRFTSEALKKLGALLGFSPAVMENTIRGHTGSLGGYALSAADALLRTVEPGRGGRPADMASLPILRRFISHGDVPYGETQTLFYESYQKIKKEYDEVRRGGKPFMDAGDVRYAFKLYNNRARSIGNLTKQEDRIVKMDIPDSEKRRRLNEIARKKKALMKDAISVFQRKPKFINILG